MDAFNYKSSSEEAMKDVTAGTVVAGKAVITDAQNKINTLDITALKLGGVAVTSSSAELNFLDTSTVGTAVASKALVLGADKNVDVLAIADLKLGAGAGTSITSTAAEINTLASSGVTNADLVKLHAVTATADNLNKAGSKASSACRLYNLGSPALADDDLIVTSTNMKVGEYDVDAQPEVPRNITVTATAAATADTMGTITVTGTNYADEVISEEIVPVAGSTVAGTKAFKSVATVVGDGWFIDASEGTNDTIKVGTGNELGLPLVLDSAIKIMLGVLGTTITATNPTVATPATIEETTIDMSSGTYDATKEALVFVVD